MVVPPAIALRVPVSQLSPVGEFFCARWTWLSTPPGVMYAPSASITFVVAERGKVVPMHEILPFFIPTSSPSDKTSLAVTCQLSVVSLLRWSHHCFPLTMIPFLTTRSKSMASAQMPRPSFAISRRLFRQHFILSTSTSYTCYRLTSRPPIHVHELVRTPEARHSGCRMKFELAESPAASDRRGR